MNENADVDADRGKQRLHEAACAGLQCHQLCLGRQQLRIPHSGRLQLGDQLLVRSKAKHYYCTSVEGIWTKLIEVGVAKGKRWNADEVHSATCFVSHVDSTIFPT